MSYKRLLEQMPTMLLSARNTLRASQAGRAPDQDFLPPVTVALSREAGIGSSAIAHDLGKRLGWPVYDHELLERIANDMQLRPEQLKRVDERPVPWLVERLETFLAKPTVTEPAYVEHLIATLLALASHGRCVVVGRGSAHLLSSQTTFRVRLVAPLEFRIRALAAREEIGKEEAASRIRQIDSERGTFVRHHFRHDPTDPHLYDLTVNCSQFSPEESADLIAGALHCFEQRERRKFHAARPWNVPQL